MSFHLAHRLRTVIGFDRILGKLEYSVRDRVVLADTANIVLDAGRVAEFDAPAKLIADPASRFHALCKAVSRSGSHSVLYTDALQF